MEVNVQQKIKLELSQLIIYSGKGPRTHHNLFACDMTVTTTLNRPPCLHRSSAHNSEKVHTFTWYLPSFVQQAHGCSIHHNFIANIAPLSAVSQMLCTELRYTSQLNSM